MKKTLLFAHRGFSGAYPENSPIAFHATAERTAADGIESDVHSTKDGQLVIFHDARLERTSNGKGWIKDHTLEELQKLDIGSWFAPEFTGQRIWTLDQLLEFCKDTKLLLNLELKNYEVFYEGLEQKVIQSIAARKMQEQVFVSSFNHISMQHFKNLCPEIQTGLLYDKPLYDMEAYISRTNADNIHPRYLLLQHQPELVSLFRRLNKKINTWTVNEEADMCDMLSQKVDCIISNYPDILCQTAKTLK